MKAGWYFCDSLNQYCLVQWRSTNRVERLVITDVADTITDESIVSRGDNDNVTESVNAFNEARRLRMLERLS